MPNSSSDRSEMVHKPTQMKPHLPTNKDADTPARFISSFFFRSVCVGFFILLLPFFQSQAPEFINQTVFTRSWELLHLLLVGIAVSYGVFSRRNVDSEKEYGGGYAPKILQVSSVFDEDGEVEQSKVETWSSRYYRGETMVVVSEDVAARTDIDRPLLLPVRSLNSRVYDADDKDASFSDGVGEWSEEVGMEEKEEKAVESVVLPSPIPWRSRSGSVDADSDQSSSSSSTHRHPRLSSATPSPKKLSPSTSLSPDFNGGEGPVVKRRNLRPPPPPPPPPPPYFYRSRPAAPFDRQGENRVLKEDVKELNRGSKESSAPSLVVESKSSNNGAHVSFRQSEPDVGRKSFRLDSPIPNNNGGNVSMKTTELDIGSKSFRLDSTNSNNGANVFSKKDELDVGSRSFRLDSSSSINGNHVSMKKGELDVGSRSLNMRTKQTREDPSIERLDSWVGSKDANVKFETLMKPKNKNIGEGLSIGKSVRTVRTSSKLDGVEMYNGHKNKVMDDDFDDLVPEIKLGFDQKLKGKYSGSDESDSDESLGENSDDDVKEEVARSASVTEKKQDENEVDRKADEFIAKFREQIRLQRIESIKKTASQKAKNIAG